MRFKAGLLTGALLLISAVASAQLVIPGAGNDKFGLIDGDRTLSISTADDGVQLNWSTAKYKTKEDCNASEPHSEELFKCLDTLVDKSWSFGLSFGITGEKGKGVLVSKGLFNPGASLSATFNDRLERDRGYFDFYGNFTASTNPLHVATLPDTGDATISDDAEKKVGFSGGVNRFFNEHFGIGGSGTVTRAISSPGTRTPISLCDTQAGTGASGHLIEASDCEDGFLAPLADQWVRTLRVDVLYNFNRYGLGSTDAPVPVATLGVIGSANVSWRTNTATTTNIAFGPVLHPKGIPHKALLALVLKLSDVTNVMKSEKPLKTRFGATLWFGIPLKGF